MAATNSTSTLTGMFKEVYGEDIKDLCPATLRLTKRIKFAYQEAGLGNKYHQPVDLAMEHGVTYAAASATGPVTLLAPVAGQMEDAQIQGAQIFARSRVDYESMFRAQAKGAKAFASATQHIVKRLTKAAAKRLEIAILHGQQGIGAVTAQSGSSTTRTYTISDASWSTGIWAGMKNATLDVFAYDYSGTKLNANAAVVVTGVTPSSKQIAVSGNSTDLSDIDTSLAADASVQLFFETSSPTNDMAGIDKIIRNTGTLFNISASTYELWGANSYSSSTGALQFGKLLEAMADPESYGIENDALAIVSPKAFSVLNQDLAALRVLDSSYSSSKVEVGTDSIKFHAGGVVCEVMTHPFQKDGQVHVVVPKEMMRIGATDLTFINRKGSDEVLILELADAAGAEMRCYANQAVFIEAPRHCTLLDGITYT